MEHRVNYVADLLTDCLESMDRHSEEAALQEPEDRAKILCALIIADAINGLRRSLTGGR